MKFPRADIHELLTSDLLHQVIKGAFKDHLVVWVEDYLRLVHGPSKAEHILDEIDRRYVQILNLAKHILTPLQYRTGTPLPWSQKVQTRTEFQTMDWK